MRVYLHSRLALFYRGSFDKMEELQALLKQQRIELREVEEGALGLSLAALAGYVNAPPPTLAYDGPPLAESCIVLSGLTEQRLSRVLGALREAGLGISYKVVITEENRNWAYGALMQQVKTEQEEEKTAAENGPKE